MLTEPQRALVSTISEGQRAVEEAERILDQKIEVPDLGTDPVSCFRAFTLIVSAINVSLFEKASLKWKQNQLDTNKQTVSSQIAAMNAATATVITLTAGNFRDFLIK